MMFDKVVKEISAAQTTKKPELRTAYLNNYFQQNIQPTTVFFLTHNFA